MVYAQPVKSRASPEAYTVIERRYDLFLSLLRNSRLGQVLGDYSRSSRYTPYQVCSFTLFIFPYDKILSHFCYFITLIHTSRKSQSPNVELHKMENLLNFFDIYIIYLPSSPYRLLISNFMLFFLGNSNRVFTNERTIGRACLLGKNKNKRKKSNPKVQK